MLTSCGIPSRVTCNQIIPGAYPGYIHPKKVIEIWRKAEHYVEQLGIARQCEKGVAYCRGGITSTTVSAVSAKNASHGTQRKRIG